MFPAFYQYGCCLSLTFLPLPTGCEVCILKSTVGDSYTCSTAASEAWVIKSLPTLLSDRSLRRLSPNLTHPVNPRAHLWKQNLPLTSHLLNQHLQECSLGISISQRTSRGSFDLLGLRAQKRLWCASHAEKPSMMQTWDPQKLPASLTKSGGTWMSLFAYCVCILHQW